MTNLQDLTGFKFHHLTVLERAPNRGHFTCWLCRCDCGKVKAVEARYLKSGATKSCGCYRKAEKRDWGKGPRKGREFMGGIVYAARCDNGKFYVGQTVVDLETRKSQHKCSKLNTKFARAIRKHGFDNFEWSVLAQIETSQADLDAAEKHYIEQYDSIANGYNTCEGGMGGRTVYTADERYRTPSRDGFIGKTFGDWEILNVEFYLDSQRAVYTARNLITCKLISITREQLKIWRKELGEI